MILRKLSLLFFFIVSTAVLVRVESAQPPFSCDSSDPKAKSYTFCRTELPISQRVRDLVSRLTLDEKITQLGNSAPAIPRLGIPAYEWWSEALHGVANVGRGIHFNGSTIKAATSFPQVILTASSFDAYQWYRIGQVIGREARAVYNAGQATGMTFWAPNINIFRDPRWGRGQETPGEDPLLTGKYAVSYVRGIQGDTFEGGKLRGHLQASACCKHFTAYDLDSWKGMTRYVFDARVTQQDMADTYQPPFQSCVQHGRASGIMCAYNRVNGVPSCADSNLLTKTARGLWGFNGYITSDCDAVGIIHDAQKYVKCPEDAVADVLTAGMDVNCGTYLRNHTKSAVEQKKLSECEIDRALHNLFKVRMRLGLFDGNPRKQPFGNIGPGEVCSPEHQTLALEAARNGIVLLKNSDKTLPFPKSKTMSLVVIGPNANSAQTLLGNYAGPPCKIVTPLQALQSYVRNTVYHQGCDSVQCSSASIDQAVNIAKGADRVVLIMGLDQTQEKEELDRVDLMLPGRQQELITCVAKAAKKPVVLVLLSGGPVDVSFAKDDKNIGSILWAGYPGQAGGTALAEIIFGDHNPGGRLTMTWYPQDFVKVPMTDMRMRPESSSGYPGRTYRFYQGQKIFEFGYGLSYSKYSYEFKYVTQNSFSFNQSSSKQMTEKSDSAPYVSVSELGTQLCNERKFTVSVVVKNHGDMAGKHPVLLFVRHENSGDGRPVKQLVGFHSLILTAAEKAEVEFEVNPCEHLSTVATLVEIMALPNGLEALTKAFSGLGVEEKSLIGILAKSHPEQRKTFRKESPHFFDDERHFERWDDDHVKLLKHEFMRFKNAVVLWTMHPWERDARLVKKALKKGPQSYAIIVEVACTRTSEELLGARKAYHSLFDHSMEEDVASRIHGVERKLLTALVSAYRYEGPKVKEDAVKSDAKALSHAIKNADKKNPVGDDEVIRILSTRNKTHLKAVTLYYEQFSKTNFFKDLSDISGHSILLETALCLCIPQVYFSKVLNAALSHEADKRTKKGLTRVIVTRADTDIALISEEYHKQHGDSLSKKIEDRGTGNYRDFLLSLVARGQ